MTPLDLSRLRDVVDDRANALQVALLVAIRLEADTRQSSRDAGQLLETVTTAAAALHQLRNNSGAR